MPKYSTVELCRTDLFSAKDDIAQKYGQDAADRVFRARAMYLWRLENPEAKDRQFIQEFNSRFDLGKSAAYEYLAAINTLMPMLSQKSKDFHLWRYNEMMLETFQLAKEKGDLKTMEKAASSYAKYNGVDQREAATIAYDDLHVQPFVATGDPTVLGIKPIPDIDQKIKAMLDKYTAQTMDIEDVEFEEADLEENILFAPYEDGESDTETSLF